MTKQKNRFWTFIFSLVPGCGQFYMGFMKRGLSLISIGVLSILVATMLGFEEFLFITFIVFAYSFFDAMNLRSLEPEQFALVKDDYFPFADFGELTGKTRDGVRIAGIGLVIFGIAVIWNNLSNLLMDGFYYLFDGPMYGVMYEAVRMIPRVALSVLIIVVGIRLIRAKKTEVESFGIETDAASE